MDDWVYYIRLNVRPISDKKSNLALIPRYKDGDV